jgi:hypothetical protein
MSDREKKTTNQKADSASTDAGQDEVQHTFDEANEKGYFGFVPDPTPNENYTVSGVTSGAPTPETDADAREAARKAARLR